MSTRNWIPEILYEEADEECLTSHIPFIPVPDNECMPTLLYIFESRETGEYEPGPEGEDLPVTEMELHQYADMAVLKNNLDGATYDKIRGVLGLEPMKTAVSKGQNITNNVRKNLGHSQEKPTETKLFLGLVDTETSQEK